jgi:glycosyltransferase involved in cell wall biosynthesis
VKYDQRRDVLARARDHIIGPDLSGQYGNQKEKNAMNDFVHDASNVPLPSIPQHFAFISHSPAFTTYMSAILNLSPRGSHTCEVGSDSGYGAVWLSLRGIHAHGLCKSAYLQERARQTNGIVGGNATFGVREPSSRQEFTTNSYNVIHHQGLINRLALPWIRSELAKEVIASEYVVFSVPSVYYTGDLPHGDERLLPLEEWQHVLSPFEICDLRYYDDPSHGTRSHILCTLRGSKTTEELRGLIHVPEEPFPQGISAIIHTRNEARQVADCIRTLQGWADEIIVCDMESEDATVAIARQFTDQIIHHPRILNFDRSRNVSAMRARFRWIFYVDADERVPPALGAALRDLIMMQGDKFAAIVIPYKHYFSGRWMRMLYPGYTSKSLFKNGRFVYHTRLHSGAKVDGATVCFPSDNPELALIHYSFESLSHYLEKLNRYTDGEAANMLRDGQPFHWQYAIRHFVDDFKSYYDNGRGPQDDVHGFLFSFLSAFYRFEQHAKLYEHRFRGGLLQPTETQVPSSVEEILEYALSVARARPLPRPAEINVVRSESGSSEPLSRIVWSGPLWSPSGYGEESRHFLLSLEESGLRPAAQPLPWFADERCLEAEDKKQLQAMTQRQVAPGFIQVLHNMAPGSSRHPMAGVAVLRTMFETDRLPQNWVQSCNEMDYVWVPTEFNRRTFSDAGVDPEKLVVVPGCVDWDQNAANEVPGELHNLRKNFDFVFVSVFEWLLKKGWDILLRAFVSEFEDSERVGLVIKTFGRYGERGVAEQATAFLKRELQHDLGPDARIRFITSFLTPPYLRGLYEMADAFVLPSRGEGWGRPYMEAMASGLPTIGTNWSGNTAFMTRENSFLIDYDLRDVPDAGWKEVDTYKGHRWAEPDGRHLQKIMRQVFTERDQAKQIGEIARRDVASRFSRKAVAQILTRELQRIETHLERGADIRGHQMARIGEFTTLVDESENNSELKTSEPTSLGSTMSKPSAVQIDIETAVSASMEVPIISGDEDSLLDEQEGDYETFIVSELEMKVNAIDLGPKVQRSVGPTVDNHKRQSVSARWEGSFFAVHSLSQVNRHLCLGLLKYENVDLSLLPHDSDPSGVAGEFGIDRLVSRCYMPLATRADVHVRHFYPPRFEPPVEGQLVLMQPWEYGYLPVQWVESIRSNVSEVWCYSEYVRDVYRNSGVPEEILQVVPLGVDPDIFTPSAPPFVFTSEPGAINLNRRRQAAGEDGIFRFLFVGGTIHRKGIDILLQAYIRAFSAYDNVCLVVKDTGTNTVYQGQNARDQICEIAGDTSRPSIVYIEDDLSPHQLAGVYSACDCLVQPSRGEGFCLPAIEAMSCGLPVIVPSGSAMEDFVDDAVGWRVPAEKRPTGYCRVGELECAGPTWTLEVQIEELAQLLRTVFINASEAKNRGAAGAQRVRERWTWRHACATAHDRFVALQARNRPKNTATAPQRSLVLLPPQNAVEPPQPIRKSDEAEGRGSNAPTSLMKTKIGSKERRRELLSLCMIVRNEEKVLGACLKSIRPWVDEIVVVDTGSDDSTTQIAEEHGARVFSFPWCDDFAAARNESLRHASGEWIFWMDADDTIPEECGRRLREVVTFAEDRISGFLMQVHIPPAPGEVGKTVVDHVKIFRNRPELRFEGRIHEQILESIYRNGGRVERTDLYVVHSGYDYSPEGQQRKRERDLRLLELDLCDRPGHPFVLFNIGMTAYHLKEFDKAVPALEECLSRSKPQESTVRKVYAMLAGCALAQGDIAVAKQWAEAGLDWFPNDPELLFRAGIIYREIGDLASAERSYLKLLTQREVGHLDSLDVSMTGFKAHHNLAFIYQDMNRPLEAERHWRAALNDNRSFVPSWIALGELYLKLRRFDDVRGIISEIAQWTPQHATFLQQRLSDLTR